MKILYITMVKPDESSGVFKKILAQISAFEEQGNKCILLILDEDKFVIYNKKSDNKWSEDDETSHNINSIVKKADIGYVRFELLRHRLFKETVEKLKNQNKKTILEIPTYPPYQESLARAREKLHLHHYAGAVKTLIGAGIVWYDCEYLAHQSDIICVVGSNKKFRGTKTIRIENGIDLCSNPFCERAKNNKVVNIIAVSNFAVWNGYDRAIKGLHNYVEENGKLQFHLTFVGDKNKARDLMLLTKEYKLSQFVTFTGSLSGDGLNDAYAHADIALGALGNHRRKVFSNSSLKAKEYAARGMLMVLSDAEGIEEEIRAVSLIVPSNETPLNFHDIEKWFISINDIDSRRTFIHNFSKEHYSWNIQVKKILSALGTNNERK